MKNYAIIENNIVVNIVVGDEQWAATQDLTLIELNHGDSALVGGKYIDGVFHKPKPYPSWVESNGGWVPPIAKPENIEGFGWMWNEEELSWISLPLNNSATNLEEPNDNFID